MTYRLFLETTKACIKNYLPESYQTKEAVIEPVIKNNSVVLQGFSMRDGKAGRAEPVLYLEPFYKAYQNGKELEDVWMELAVRYDAAQKEIQTVSISYQCVMRHRMHRGCRGFLMISERIWRLPTSAESVCMTARWGICLSITGI